MATLYDDLMNYKDWTGNREDLLAVLSQLEELHAADCMLKSSKAPYDLLPVNLRRIQWFSSNRIIPEAPKRLYGLDHLVYYMHAISLRRKAKRTFKQISGQIDEFTLEDALNNLAKGVVSAKVSAGYDEGLRKLGRKEGRPLKSTLTRFAITPWCHVTINEKYTRDLTSEDVDVLTQAFHQSVYSLIND